MAAITSATAATLDAALARLAPTPLPLRPLFDDGTLRCDDLLYCDDGAIFAQRLGGAQAAIVPPYSVCPAAADELTAALVAHLSHAGQRVLQAVVPIPPPASITSLARAGFAPVTDLIFLTRDITAADAAIPPRLSFTAAAADDLAFAAVIEATYFGTQDLPELNGTRSVAETLAAAQSAAKLDPPLWWYARAASEIVGVVQLAPGEESGELELLYMGLVPAARGQGLGRELARACLAIAAALDATRLTLSFDARNASAGRVYEQLGFEPVGRRAVWLRISEPSPPLLGSLGKP